MTRNIKIEYIWIDRHSVDSQNGSSIQIHHSSGLSPPPAPKLTHGTAPIRFARGKATKFSSRDRSGVEQPRHFVPYLSWISLVPPKR